MEPRRPPIGMHVLALAVGIGAMLSAGLPLRAEEPVAPTTISLKTCDIWTVPDLPPSVRAAVADLQRVLESRTGRRPPVRPVPQEPSELRVDPVIQIGLTPIAALDAAKTLPPTPLPESYAIATRWSGEHPSRFPVVAVGGGDAAGLKFGIIELIRRLRVAPADVGIDLPLHVAKRPRFETRGMYAHLHWSYNRPYALRAWPLDDWKRYVDLLTHLGFNTIQIWPMMELLPHPLSPDDQAYLRKYAEIVRYAREHRGMTVFIGSCPNNITENARGVPIEKREYFDFEKLLDPGVPENLRTILEYRSDLYRTVPDADGYWVIDSDPGGWKGSPSSAFVDVLVGHRELIDKYGKRPSQQPVIYWMWFSWGKGSREENWRATLADMKDRLKDPWRVHLCFEAHLQAAKELHVLDRGIYFPYGLIEDEPAGPWTELRFDRIQRSIELAARYGLRAAQGNAQTPLAQLPNIAAISHVLWGGDASKDGDAILQALATQLVSKDADVLVRAWKSLAAADADASLRLAEQVQKLADDPSARGVLAELIGDWQSRVLTDLAMILPVHGHAVRFAALAGDGDPLALRDAFVAYLDAAARWLDRTGYHNRNIVFQEAFRGIVVAALEKLNARFGKDKLLAEIISPACDTARRTAPADFVDALRDTLLGQRK